MKLIDSAAINSIADKLLECLVPPGDKSLEPASTQAIEGARAAIKTVLLAHAVSMPDEAAVIAALKAHQEALPFCAETQERIKRSVLLGQMSQVLLAGAKLLTGRSLASVDGDARPPMTRKFIRAQKPVPCLGVGVGA